MEKPAHKTGAKNNSVGSPDEPKWKLIERVVALLEKALTPEAEVEHNVELPDITTGHLRQCDVIIRYGKPPRQTLSIVEVQDRKSKVEIGHLQSWWEKMQSVGAQHLICVSALDYPQSVKDDVAKKRGPAVRLLCLRQIEQCGWPFDIVGGNVTITIPNVTLRKLRIELEGPSQFGHCLTGKDTDAVFWQDGAAGPKSPLNLLDECLDAHPTLSMFPEGKHEATCALKPGRRLWVQVQGRKQVVRRLEMNVEVEAIASNIPVTLSAYEQVNHNGALAWAATGAGKVRESEVQLRFILIPQDDGTFSVARCELTEDQEYTDGWLTFEPLDTAPPCHSPEVGVGL